MNLEAQTPISYARYLAGYISDPSTIRARVMREYGRAPSLDECRKIRERIAGKKDRFFDRTLDAPEHGHFECGHERSAGNSLLRENGRVVCKICRRKLEAEAAKRYREKQRAEREAAAIKKLRTDKPLFPAWYNPPAVVRPKVASDTLQLVADAFMISYGELIGTDKHKHFVDARAVVVRILRQAGMSYAAIGKWLKKDHSSILNLYRNWDKRAARNPMVRDVYTRIVSTTA